MSDPWAEFRVQAPTNDPWAEFRAPSQQPPERTRYGNVPAPSWVPAPIARAVDFLGGVTRQGQRAITLGASDEARAGANALGQAAATGQPIGEAYDAELPRVRAEDQRFQQDHPVASTGAQIVAGTVTPGVGRAATMGGAILRGALAGGAYGAAAGFGEGEGGFQQRMASALTGGAVGGAVGGAAPVVIGGLGRAVSAVGNRLGIGDPNAEAQRLVLRELSRDGVTPDELLRRSQAAGSAPAMVADLADENTRGAAAMVARVPGEGRATANRAVTARGGAAQGERLAAEIRTAVAGDDFRQTADDFIAARRTNAAPRYAESFRRIVPTEAEVARLLPGIEDPIGQRALREGLRVIQVENVADRLRDPSIPPFNLADYGVTRGENGRLVVANGYRNLRLLDAIKRGYDEIVEGFRDSATGRLNLNQYSRAVNSARAAYVANLRDLFPRYGNALDAWAGPSQMLDRMNAGRRLLSMAQGDFEISAQDIAKFSPSEREAFRVGVARGLLDRIGNAVDGAEQTRINRIFATPNVRERLRAAFDTDAEFNAFADALRREASMAATNRAIAPGAGSQTMPLQERRADWASPPPGPVMGALIDPERAAATGAPTAGVLSDVVATARSGGATTAPFRLIERLQQGNRARAFERNANAAAPILMETDPARREVLIRALLARAHRDRLVGGATSPLAAALMRGAPIAGALATTE